MSKVDQAKDLLGELFIMGFPGKQMSQATQDFIKK